MKKLFKKRKNTRGQRAGNWEWIYSIQYFSQIQIYEKGSSDRKKILPTIHF